MQVQSALDGAVDLSAFPLSDAHFTADCKRQYETNGIVILDQFLTPRAVAGLVAEAESRQHMAFFTARTHNVYLTPQNPELGAGHIFNRQLQSSKGCITTDQIPEDSLLKQLYGDPTFKQFIATVVGVDAVSSEL